MAPRAPTKGTSDAELVRLAAKGLTLRAIGARVRLDHSTVHERLSKPDNKKLLEQLRRERLERAATILETYTTKAAHRLGKMATGAEKANKDQIAACRATLALSGVQHAPAAPDQADTSQTPSPHTPEGREALLAQLVTLPADLLEEARRRRDEATPAHLRKA